VWLGVVCVLAHFWTLVLQLLRVCLVGLWLVDWFLYLLVDYFVGRVK